MPTKIAHRGNGAATNGAAAAGHVKDMRLMREGPHAHRVGGPEHAGAAPDSRALRQAASTARHAHRGVPPRHRPRPANLARTLKAGGAEVYLCGSNPLSTQDDVAAALVGHYDIATFAIKGEDHKTYYSHILSCIEARPHLTMDDGCDLVTVLPQQEEELPARRVRRHRRDLDRRHETPRHGGGEGA
jgi:hypothetical protein